MAGVDSSFVLLPRFTTLAGATTFTSLPMDVSMYGEVQFQVWRGPMRTKTMTPTPRFEVTLYESLDTETWVLGPSAPGPHVILPNEPRFFSYGFRLRWFRLAVTVAGDEPIVSCWAEGLLRGGGSGLWPLMTPGVNGNVLDGRMQSRGPGGRAWWEAELAAQQLRQAAIANLGQAGRANYYNPILGTTTLNPLG